MASFITRRMSVDSTDKDELLSYLVNHLYTDGRVPFIAMQGRSNLEGYSITYMTNSWRWGQTPNQKWRSRCKSDVIKDSVDVSDDFNEHAQAEKMKQVDARLKTLEPHERRLYQMYYLEEQTIRQIASAVRLSPSVIHKMLVVVRGKLSGAQVKVPTRQRPSGKDKITG